MRRQRSNEKWLPLVEHCLSILPVLLHGTSEDGGVHFACTVADAALYVASALLVSQVILGPAPRRVPLVLAASPGHIGAYGLVKVVHSPGEHDDVVNVEPKSHDGGRIADTLN